MICFVREGVTETLKEFVTQYCLMLDFFGCEKEKMGYVPFVSEKTGDMNFERKDELFSFPYGFKHGKVIEITDEEYEKLRTV